MTTSPPNPYQSDTIGHNAPRWHLWAVGIVLALWYIGFTIFLGFQVSW